MYIVEENKSEMIPPPSSTEYPNCQVMLFNHEFSVQK